MPPTLRPPAAARPDSHEPPDATLPRGIEPNMRRLRTLVAVAQCHSVNRAAERLHVTQSAVTRGVQALEDEIGLALFERTARGMNPTAPGQIVVERAQRALSYLDAAEHALLADGSEGASQRASIGLAGKAVQRHLQAVSAIADHLTETASALQLGISQPAVTQALRDLEDLVGASLFVRTSQGMMPTRQGDIVIRGAKLALNEIAAVGADLAAHLGLVRGRLMVGALPLSGTQIAPQLLSRVAKAHPGLRLCVVEAQYDRLLQSLRCGDLDVIVGALMPLRMPDVSYHHLFDDEMVVVVRRGHPLTRRRTLSLSDLDGAGWVAPFRRVRVPNTVEKVMMQAGLRLPEDAIEASSVAMVRGLLMESDRISALSRRQIYYEEREGLLSVLPLKLGGASLPIGYMMRTDAQSTVGLATLVQHLRDMQPAVSRTDPS